MDEVATSVPSAFVVSTVLGSEVTAKLVVVEFVVVRLVIVATAAVRESASAVVKRPSVEKKEVEVALVIVAFDDERFWIVEEPYVMRPALKVRSVEVAPFTNASCTVVPIASVPQMRTPAAVAFTSQLAAFKEETTRFVVDAVSETVRLVDDAFPNVVWPVNVLVFVNVFAVYVLAIVVEESTKFCVEVVENERPTEAKYVADEVEKKSRLFFHSSALVVEKKLFVAFQASAEVVDHASPAAAKYCAEVVEKKLFWFFQNSADDVENEFAMR